MTTKFFTSDTHFDHARVIEYCKRPFSDVSEMNETIISNWNKTVKPGDLVYHLGDFAFIKDTEKYLKLLARLNGSIHLIKGNHDRLDAVVAKEFATVSNYKEIKDEADGNKVVLSHYSHRVWNRSHRGSLMLYGHSHGSLKGCCQSLDVGVDAWDFTPVTLEQIKRRMKTLGPLFVNHREEE